MRGRRETRISNSPTRLEDERTARKRERAMGRGRTGRTGRPAQCVRGIDLRAPISDDRMPRGEITVYPVSRRPFREFLSGPTLHLGRVGMGWDWMRAMGPGS